jgi:FlaA1/EpsC-like NDP-sugar epimerase
MQDNPEEAISNNVLGTMNVLDGALRVGAGASS